MQQVQKLVGIQNIQQNIHQAEEGSSQQEARKLNYFLHTLNVCFLVYYINNNYTQFIQQCYQQWFYYCFYQYYQNMYLYIFGKFFFQRYYYNLDSCVDMVFILIGTCIYCSFDVCTKIALIIFLTNIYSFYLFQINKFYYKIKPSLIFTENLSFFPFSQNLLQFLQLTVIINNDTIFYQLVNIVQQMFYHICYYQ
eukprot:TRINITY_DN5958_c0_g1_i1.p2 TRINITY_DN5958_c0_g1~~TRINITY_DN5958_c0_g1_i1.p2  ORF type:complete len:195 (-),score=-33.67 TRINITY_DN5958_c0_g1_i1:1062-1646(-)